MAPATVLEKIPTQPVTPPAPEVIGAPAVTAQVSPVEVVQQAPPAQSRSISEIPYGQLDRDQLITEVTRLKDAAGIPGELSGTAHAVLADLKGERAAGVLRDAREIVGYLRTASNNPPKAGSEPKGRIIDDRVRRAELERSMRMAEITGDKAAAKILAATLERQ